MKKILHLLTGLAMLVGLSSAVADEVCQPYNIVNKTTIMACPAGYSGVQYKTTTKVCPSGLITNSEVYITSGCTPINSSAGGVSIPAKVSCTSDANSSCATVPNAAGCPTGKHWTLAGSNVAHCVLNDYVCPFAQSITHDFLGNPSCIANTCPSNQVLQGDGISCACAGGLSWNGSSCVAISCTPSSVPNAAVACAYGYSGTMYTSTVTSCPSGSSGAPSVSTSGYNTSGCVAWPITCTPSSYDLAPVSCGAGYSGTKYRTSNTTCPSGPYGSPSTSLTGYDTSGCSPLAVTCTPTSYSNSPISCGAGFTGTQYTTTTISCPSGPYGAPSSSTSGYDTSGCAAKVVTCIASSSPNSPVSCGATYNGTMYTTTTTSCPSGPYGSPSTSTSGYNTSGCTPKTETCSAGPSGSNSQACGAGFTGTKTQAVTTSCPAGPYGSPSTSTGGWDTSGCGCANGATNYPTCVLPPPPQIVYVNCPVSVTVVFTSMAQNSVCWNQMTNPTPPQVPQGSACTYGPPIILNYGVRGGLQSGGTGCQFN